LTKGGKVSVLIGPKGNGGCAKLSKVDSTAKLSKGGGVEC